MLDMSPEGNLLPYLIVIDFSTSSSLTKLIVRIGASILDFNVSRSIGYSQVSSIDGTLEVVLSFVTSCKSLFMLSFW